MSLLDLALLLCPREFREGYRRDMRPSDGREAFDVLRAGVTLHSEAFLRDALFALKTLRKSPVFAAVAVGTLALAISINAVVFAALDSIAQRTLPFVQPQRLAMLCYRPVSQGCGQIDNGVIGAYMRDAKTLEGIAAFQYFSMTLLGRGAPQALQAYASSPNVFAVLGVKPELGQFFDAKHWFGRVVLSDRLWRSSFGADPHVIGSIVNFGGSRLEVVGVAPAHTYMPVPGAAPAPARSMWVALPPSSFERLGAFNDWAFARLKPGVGAEAAAADVNRVTAQVVRRHPVREKGLSIAAVPLTSFYYADVRRFLLLMMAAVSAVLLIACANIANLVLVRCMSRNPEFALRSALGATRSRVLKQVAIEIALLSCAGGALGMLLAYLERAGLRAAGSGLLIPGIGHAPIDARVVAFVGGAVLVTSLLAGVVPALLSTRRDLTQTLKPAGGSGGARTTKRFRVLLGAAQVALAFAVIVGSGLLYRSFSSLAGAPLGIDTHGVYYTRTNFFGYGFRRQGARAQFIQRALARIEAIPGVESAAAVRPNPYLGDGAEAYTFELPGHAYGPRMQPQAALTEITPGYFRTLRVPIVAGRSFTGDDTAASQPVAIVDRHFVRAYFAGRDPIGARVLAPVPSGADPSKPRYEAATIVGVVRDIPKYGRADMPRLYVPEAQNPSEFAQMLIRTRHVDSDLRAQVAAAVASVNPNVALDEFGNLQQHIDRNIAPERAIAKIAAIVAAIALLLALAGIYAVVVYSAERQRQEFGVRLALGARRGDMLRVVLRVALGIGTLGIGAGVILAVLASRLISPMLFDVSPFDPLTFGAVIALVGVSVLLASLLPAVDASRVDPAVTLRYE